MHQKKGFTPIIIIGIVVLILAIAGGGGYYLMNKNKQSENNNNHEQQKHENQTTKITGWKKYIPDSGSVYDTNDWSSYNLINSNTSFSIEYPNDWSLDYSVFQDSKGEKIAEFSPGLVVLNDGQKCFDVVYNEEGLFETLFQTETSINGLQCVFRKNKIYLDGGPSLAGVGYWYGNEYCLSDGKNAFVMTFYDKELDSEKTEIFNQILSTFKFF